MIANDIAGALIDKGRKQASGLVLILDEYTIVQIVTAIMEKQCQDVRVRVTSDRPST